MTTTSSSTGNGGTFADWMANLPEHLHSVPLCQLAIPGSHNSATYFMDENDDFSADAPPPLRSGPVIIQAMAKVPVKNWSVCQSLSLTQQMEAGIRFLDFRVALKPNSNTLHIVHSLYGPRVEQCIEELSNFLSEHKREIIMVDFTHFYWMTDREHKHLLEMLLNKFEDRMCPLLDTECVTLDTLWSSGLQLIIFYHHPLVSDYLQFWPGTCVPSPWSNTTSIDTMITALEGNYTRGRCNSSFHVTQGVLTPDTQFIMSNFAGKLRDNLAGKAAQPFVDWLKLKHAGESGINICVMDFIEMSEYVSTVIQLNQTIQQK